MAFGETLTYLRKSRGLSQEQLAGELDLTRQTISKWELNQSTPDLAYLVRLSDFFGVSTDYLVRGEQENRASGADDAEYETSNVMGASKQAPSVNVHRWCFYLGIISMGVSLLGMIAFVICSALHPWGAVVNYMYFEGLLGFLIGTSTLWFFVVLLVLFAAGATLSVYAILKNRKKTQ